jgi:hypothetical protein
MDPRRVSSFKNRIQSRVKASQLVNIGSESGEHSVVGVVVRDMYLRGAGGECIRIRNNASHNVVAYSTIQWCGMRRTSADQGGYQYHDGEGVYLGTSPKSIAQPMHENDGTAYNFIHDNVIRTFGSECVDIKENAHDNVIANNDCGYNDEPLPSAGSNIEIRGDHNIISGNRIFGSSGYGLKFASDRAIYDRGGNVATNNRFEANIGASIYVSQHAPQGEFCGNRLESDKGYVGPATVNSDRPCP